MNCLRWLSKLKFTECIRRRTDQSCSRSYAFAQLSFFLITHHTEPEAEQSRRPPPVPINITSQKNSYLASQPNTTSPSPHIVRLAWPCCTPLHLSHPVCALENGKVKHPRSNPSLPPIFPHALLRKHLSVQEIRVWWGGEEQWKNDGGGRGTKWVRERQREWGAGG